MSLLAVVDRLDDAGCCEVRDHELPVFAKDCDGIRNLVQNGADQSHVETGTGGGRGSAGSQCKEKSEQTGRDDEPVAEKRADRSRALGGGRGVETRLAGLLDGSFERLSLLYHVLERILGTHSGHDGSTIRLAPRRLEPFVGETSPALCRRREGLGSLLRDAIRLLGDGAQVGDRPCRLGALFFEGLRIGRPSLQYEETQQSVRVRDVALDDARLGIERVDPVGQRRVDSAGRAPENPGSEQGKQGDGERASEGDGS